MTKNVLLLVASLFSVTVVIRAKYIEGELVTSDNWAFLARFCFLSEHGEFEYYFEYDGDQGTPNLLLYYDAIAQWPAVYKSNKTCLQRENVLNVEQNQLIKLTPIPPYSEISGCSYKLIPSNEPTLYPPVPTKPTVRTKTYLNFPKRNITRRRPITTLPPLTVSSSSSSSGTSTTPAALGNVTNFDFYEVFNASDTENVYSTAVSATAHPIKKRAIPVKPQNNPRDGSRLQVVCHNARRFRSSRERWWFLAISNCHGMQGIRLRYRILMTNGAPGDYWHEHFSADEFYILPVLMAFTIAYSMLILAIVMCSVELKSRQLLHSTYKLFVFSVTLQLFGILMESIAYLKYAVNGVGAPKVRIFGRLFMGSSETFFLLLLLLLAKGYTVTRGRLRMGATVKLTVFMCLYSVTYVTLFIYEAKVFDPGEVLYLYESPAGYGLIVLRIIAWCMFIYSTVFTLKHYPEKSNFYYPFNVCGTLWFISGPAFILSANSYIDKWVRESVVCGVLLFITFAGHLMFLILTLPSMANKNFPYHVRTTQIGIMETMGGVGTSTLEQFGHHVYQPGVSTPAAEQTVIIPLTKRTEEIFGGIYSQRLGRHASTDSEASAADAVPDVDAAASMTMAIRRQYEEDFDMNNVHSWAQAKNANSLAVFEPMLAMGGGRSGLGSASSRATSNGGASVNGRYHGGGEEYGHGIGDYVKEVPVELFTVSKMVVLNGKSGALKNIGAAAE